MSREWKSGQLAASEHAGISVVSERCDRHFAGGLHWHHMSGGWDALDSRGRFRPLAAIDPENRPEVERLARAIVDALPSHVIAPDLDNALQAALRALANPEPPKPDEPIGLGAVVEDAEGVPWTRIYTHADDCNDWRRADLRFYSDKEIEYRRSWSELTPVRVLSEGVTL